MAGDQKFRSRVDLNANIIRGLKPRALPFEVPDNRVVGLRVVCHPSGAKAFAIRYEMGDGRARKFTLGPWPRLRITDARKVAAKRLRDVHSGVDPGVLKKEAKKAAKAGTVADAFNTFKAEHLSKKRSGKETERIFNRYVLPKIGKRPIAFVNKADMIEILKGVKAPAMSNRTYSALSKFWKFVAGRNIVVHNPMNGVTKLHEENKARDRLLSDTEVRILWEATGQLGHPWRQLYRTLIITGMRLNEAAKLKFDELNRAENVIVIEGGRTKNSVPRAIWITPLLDSVLREINLADVDFVFQTAPKRSVAPSGFSKAKAKLDSEIQRIAPTYFEGPFAPFVIHDLRRVVRSAAPRLGIDKATAEKMIGHVSGEFGGVGGVYNRYQYVQETKAGFVTYADHLTKIIGI
jgi:integrase